MKKILTPKEGQDKNDAQRGIYTVKDPGGGPVQGSELAENLGDAKYGTNAAIEPP